MKHDYDHVFTVTTDLTTDRRMQRICETIALEGNQVLLIGRERVNSKNINAKVYDQKRLKCWFDSGVLFYIEFNVRLILLLNKITFNKLTSVDLDTILSGRILNIHKSFDWYFDAHEYFTEVPELLNRPIKKWMWSTVGKHCIPRTLKRYTVGPILAQTLSDKYGCSFDVIRNLPIPHIDASRAIKRQNPPPFIITYLGVLNEGRGINEMISSMDELDDCELWLIGEGDLSYTLREQVRLSKSQMKVKFYGTLSDQEFEPLLRSSHLGINLLRAESKSYYFSMANKFFDYIHHDLPVLTMSFPEYQRIIDTYQLGFTIDSLEKESIVKCIKYIKQDKTGLLETKRQNCKAAKVTFNWMTESKRLVDIYR